MLEIWKTIKYCNKYQISNFGNVKSLCRGKVRLLKVSYDHDGYAMCKLWYGGSQHTFRVNRLVAEHFIPNDSNKDTVNHIDGDKLNNHADNLEWTTRSEQMKHAYKKGLKQPMQGTLHKKSKLTEQDVAYIRANYKARDKEFGMLALAEKFNVSGCTIKRVVNGTSYFNVK